MVNYSKNSPVDGKINKIIEYFVKIFGEKYRRRITERINNTFFVFMGQVNGKRYYDDIIPKIFDTYLFFEKEFEIQIQEFMNLENSNIEAFTFPGCAYSDLSRKDATKNICVFPPYSALYTFYIIHELMHVITSDIIIIDRKIRLKYGFDIIEQDLIIGRQTTNCSNCKILNEIITDYLALKVFKLMCQDNFTIGKEQYRSSSYSKLFPILEGFIENNMDDIIESVMSPDPTKFINKIGADNFKLLALFVDKVYNLPQKDIFDEDKIFDTTLSPEYINEINECISLFSQIKPILTGEKTQV